MSCLSDSLYPFTALVGQERMKKALVLNAIDPGIGGVLIRGQKGTAKSTAVRALADVLPQIEVVEDCPFGCNPSTPAEMCTGCRSRMEQGETLPTTHRKIKVVDLPLNATEDRVAGTLDLEHAIKKGERRFEPGVLAEAHRGILYVDEVNLLDDHLVDVLLDTAAMGVNTVEREGISHSHPSHFILVGTMNPEEGELRPQFLDRFALCVEVEGLADPRDRVEIIKRRAEYEADPPAFVRSWGDAQEVLRRSIVTAKDMLSAVNISDEMLHLIAEICVDMGVHGHRSDITIMKVARALAALHQRPDVTESDIREAAELALPHRMRRRPFDDQRLDEDRLEETIARHREQNKRSAEVETPHVPSEKQSDNLQSDARVFEVGDPYPVKTVAIPNNRRNTGLAGRRQNSNARSKSGKYVRSAIPPEPCNDIALDASLRAAAPHQSRRQGDMTINLATADLRAKVRERKVGSSILFVVDASGSMGAKRRMVAAKGAVLSLLIDAYQHRDRVGMIAFRGNKAELLLPLTNSVELANEKLKALPTGGKTPLAHGLYRALEVLRDESKRNGDTLRLLVLITDGKANVSLRGGSALEEAKELAALIRQQGISMLVIDTENDFVNLGLARAIAEAANAEYARVDELADDTVAGLVRALL